MLWFRRATAALADTLRSQASQQTAVLQDWLTVQLGTADWFGGTDFGWADAAVAAMVNRSVFYGMRPSSESSLARWHQLIKIRPSVAATFAEVDAAAARRIAAADHYTTGGRRHEYRDHRLEWKIKSGDVDVVLAGLRDGNIRFSWPSTK